MAHTPSRVIRVFPDYGADWPLWEDGLMFPDDYALSTELTAELRDWVDFWEANFHHLSGWNEPALRAGWIASGREITERLRAEVGADIEVEYDETQY